MSKKLFYFIALLGAMVVFAPACGDKDACKDVDCGPNGTCFEGTCECFDGFEGTACETEWAEKFLGPYLGFDICAGTTYNLTKPAVVTRRNEQEVRISNFGGFDSFLDAAIANGNQLTFTNFTDPAGRRFTGTAQISGNTLTGNYTVTYSDNTTESCTFTYTK